MINNKTTGSKKTPAMTAPENTIRRTKAICLDLPAWKGRIVKLTGTLRDLATLTLIQIAWKLPMEVKNRLKMIVRTHPATYCQVPQKLLTIPTWRNVRASKDRDPISL